MKTSPTSLSSSFALNQEISFDYFQYDCKLSTATQMYEIFIDDIDEFFNWLLISFQESFDNIFQIPDHECNAIKHEPYSASKATRKLVNSLNSIYSFVIQ